MKKVLGLFILAVSLSSFGQGFAEGDNVLGAGIGLGNTYITSGTSTKFIPVQVYYEAGISDHLAIGGFLGYTSTSGSAIYVNPFNSISYGYKFTYNYTLIGLRGAYHFGYLLGTVDNFDLYGGLSMGYAILGTKVESSGGAPEYPDSVNNGGLHVGIYAGMRYYFDDSFGVFGEIGYNISVLQVGAVFKL